MNEIIIAITVYCRRQDVAFFDANKTGQLVNRLTSDIQEFKSSFKLVISQVGCYVLSYQVKVSQLVLRVTVILKPTIIRIEIFSTHSNLSASLNLYFECNTL